MILTALRPALQGIEPTVMLVDELNAVITEESYSIHRAAAHRHNRLQPIFRIPIEILSYILELVAALPDAPKTSLLPTGVYLPLSQSFISISLSCQRFREIAVNAPGCWKEAVIWVAKRHSTSSAALDSYLQRSSSLLFNATIYLDTSAIKKTYIQELLTVLHSHVHRCRSIEVWSGRVTKQVSQITKIIRDLRWSYPSLRSVKLADYSSNATAGEHKIQLVPFWTREATQINSIDVEFEGWDEVIDPAPQ
ncbi:hypothetical protein DL93DRAFT_1360689 [Clavulina sp. PMI_390]|nr:hypothetical protein DL93DRAFT_1360689 [Clavulina sp. PMI_390]